MMRVDAALFDTTDARVTVARDSFAAFIWQTFPTYQMGWFHELICLELEKFVADVQAKKSPRLMLTAPPRSGKSEIVSRRFPAWALGKNPDLSIIAASYSADLASRMNRDVQRIIESEEYQAVFPDTKLYGKDSRSVANGSYLRNSDIFEIVGHSGVYRSAGVGGGITGLGAEICCIDDVFKDRMSADSPTIRQNIWEWYTSTLYTRLAPGGGVLIIGTRWHEDDLSGRLLAAQAKGEGDAWRVINFPAIAEEDEAHRKKGEALHPERYPLEQLLKIKAAIGTRDWEALYQQHPTPEGGAVFLSEWLRRTWLPKDLPERFDKVVQSWDMTFKDGAESDFVVGQLWGKKGADYYLLEQMRGRWSFTQSVEMVRSMQAIARRYCQGTCRVLIEDKANGPAIIDVLKHEISGIIPVEPDGTKLARAHAVTALFEAGNVLLPDVSIAPWVNEFRLELTRFPNAAHDDQVDSASMAIRYLDKRQGLHISNDLFRRIR